MSNSTRRVPRKTIVVAIATGLALVAGVAFALYILTAKVGGTATTKSLGYAWAQSPAPTTTGSGTCTATIGTAGQDNTLSINVSGYPGDECTVSGSLMVSGSESARVTGINLTGLPAGWKADVGNTCGKTFAVGTASAAPFKITVGPSGSGTLGGGLDLSPVSQTGTNPLTCTVQAP